MNVNEEKTILGSGSEEFFAQNTVHFDEMRGEISSQNIKRTLTMRQAPNAVKTKPYRDNNMPY